MSFSLLMAATCASNGLVTSSLSPKFVIRFSEKSVRTCGIMATSTSVSKTCLVYLNLSTEIQQTALEAWVLMCCCKNPKVNTWMECRSPITCVHSVEKAGCNMLLYMANLVTRKTTQHNGPSTKRLVFFELEHRSVLSSLTNLRNPHTNQHQSHE